MLVILLCWSNKIEEQHRGGKLRPQAEVLTDDVHSTVQVYLCTAEEDNELYLI